MGAERPLPPSAGASEVSAEITEVCSALERDLKKARAHPRDDRAWIEVGRHAGCLYIHATETCEAPADCEEIYARLLALGTRHAVLEVSGSVPLEELRKRLLPTPVSRCDARAYTALAQAKERQDSERGALEGIVAEHARLTRVHDDGRVQTHRVPRATIVKEVLETSAYWPPGATCSGACCSLTRNNDGDDNRGSCMSGSDVTRVCFDAQGRISQVVLQLGPRQD